MRVDFQFASLIPQERLAANRRHTASLRLPGLATAAHPNLAVVGGGPSVVDRLEELSTWEGEIWAINGAWPFLVGQGVDATFYTVDADPKTAECAMGVDHAVVADFCDPSLFAALGGAKIEAVELSQAALEAGCTSASTAAAIAIDRGHRHVTFFGCESNYGERTHVYRNIRARSLIVVETVRGTFLTSPDFLRQAEFLAECIRTVPHVYAEKSGGLLAALVEDERYDLVAASNGLWSQLRGDARWTRVPAGVHGGHQMVELPRGQ